jgi:DNA topoisomerase I
MSEDAMPTPAPDEVEQNAIDSLGLRRVATSELTIERRMIDGTASFTRGGRKIGARERKRIAELVIPPAWSDVRVADDRDAHLQAIGRDDAGRLQYIYHDAWEDVRAAAKASRLLHLGSALPRLRPAVDDDLGLDNENLPLACAARLVDHLHLRAGHECYAGEEGGRGVATLLKRHLALNGNEFRLVFRGKGGKRIEKTCSDPRLFEALRELRKHRGPRLFKLPTGDGYRPMTAADLNRYLADRSGRPITAKDFRTLYASATALDRLGELETGSSVSMRRRWLADTARVISDELANTPAITRKSYIHPRIVEKFEAGELDGLSNGRARDGQTAAESKLMRFLEAAMAVKSAA